MNTAASLRSQTSKDLAKLAKQKGVPGWHSMRKEQLILALLKLAKEKTKSKKASPASRVSAGPKKSGPTTQRTAKKVEAPESDIAKAIRADRMQRERMKDLALTNSIQKKEPEPVTDKIVLLVRDPYWLHAYWEVTKVTVQRAKAALANSWHSAKPVLRLLETNNDTVGAVENVVKEIPVHGGVKNWYIDVTDPPHSYRVALGYMTDEGKFHLIATSNEVKTPAPGNGSLDDNWSDVKDEYEKYYALSGGYDNSINSGELQNVFEQKLRKPMEPPMFAKLGLGMGGQTFELPFEVDAQLVVYGATAPNAKVTMSGEPVQLEDDGTFCVRMGLPDRRQVLPIVASSRDGSEQRTTVLAVERNTKVMERVTRDPNEAVT